LAEGAPLIPFPVSGRSRDAEGGEVRPEWLPDSSPGIAMRSWAGEWHCACGQRYRVLLEPLTFWPRSPARGFRTEPAEDCVSCRVDLEETFGLEAARIVLHLGA
jgi:hypothetical protein